ncbi:T9SS type A sorting domain-containing protein [Salmonella enterica]|uniref:T9SS type A sorting domain-containing protein n=1 Tax=Salmonella enterica TaxID=28901 RepID=UPI00359C4777
MALYDLQGRLLLEKQVENHQEFHTLDLNSLADGIYMYQVSAAGRSLKTGKLVVIK